MDDGYIQRPPEPQQQVHRHSLKLVMNSDCSSLILKANHLLEQGNQEDAYEIIQHLLHTKEVQFEYTTNASGDSQTLYGSTAG